MIDEKYYKVTDAKTPRLPHFEESEREAPKSAKWVHMRTELPVPGGELAENYIMESEVRPEGNGILDVEYSTDDGGWISIVVKDQGLVDRGAEILMETLQGIDIDVEVDTEIDLDGVESDDEDEPPRYIQ